MAKKKIISFLAVFVSLLILDFLVISNLVFPLYEEGISQLLNEDVNIYSSLIAWFLIALGVSIIIVPLSKNKIDSFKNGAIFGLVLYGVYDFTNYAIIKGWTIEMVLFDVLWGIILCGTISVVGKLFIK